VQVQKEDEDEEKDDYTSKSAILWAKVRRINRPKLTSASTFCLSSSACLCADAE